MFMVILLSVVFRKCGTTPREFHGVIFFYHRERKTVKAYGAE